MPSVSRKATSASPSILTRTGAQSGSGISSESSAGSQWLRKIRPIGALPSTRTRSSFSSGVSMGGSGTLDQVLPVLQPAGFGLY